MGKRRGNQSARQLSVSTRTRYRQSLPHDETAASLLTFHPILLGGRDRRARLRTLHRRPLVIRGTIVLVHPWPALGGGEHNTIGRRRQWWRAVTFALESIPPGGEGRCGGYYQITHTRWGRSWLIGSSRRTAAGPHHCRHRRQMTAAATSSCSGRRQPRHGREAFHARGGEQLVVNRPEALRHEREG